MDDEEINSLLAELEEYESEISKRCTPSFSRIFKRIFRIKK